MVHIAPQQVPSMPKQVVNNAVLACSMSPAPGTLLVPPVNMENSTQQPAATIMDFVPMKNIQPFGMCMSPSNPAVIAATAAALGVFTPMPCMPATTGPWTPGSPTVLLKQQVALNNTSTCACMWAGVITVTQPGQMTHDIP
jgi:hypothetical protein